MKRTVLADLKFFQRLILEQKLLMVYTGVQNWLFRGSWSFTSHGRQGNLRCRRCARKKYPKSGTRNKLKMKRELRHIRDFHPNPDALFKITKQLTTYVTN